MRKAREKRKEQTQEKTPVFKTLKTKEQLLKGVNLNSPSRLLDSRKVFKSEMKEHYEKFHSHYQEILKKKFNIEVTNKDFEIIYDQDKNAINIVQEAEIIIKDTYKVTDEMREAGIKGEYVTTEYPAKNLYVIGKIRNCSKETLDLFGFKVMPKPKLEAKKKRLKTA
jgi:hypothetical protein